MYNFAEGHLKLCSFCCIQLLLFDTRYGLLCLTISQSALYYLPVYDLKLTYFIHYLGKV